MKNHKTILVMLFTLCITFGTKAQQGGSKPNLFDNFPKSIECNDTELARIFDSPKGQFISVATKTTFTFSGVIADNIVPYANLQSVLIKSPQFDNAFLSISKAINPDGSFAYTGNIIHPNYADGYTLSKNDNGSYMLTKMELSKILSSCNQ